MFKIMIKKGLIEHGTLFTNLNKKIIVALSSGNLIFFLDLKINHKKAFIYAAFNHIFKG